MATWPYYLFAVVAGAMLPFQFGINSVLARYVDGSADHYDAAEVEDE